MREREGASERQPGVFRRRIVLRISRGVTRQRALVRWMAKEKFLVHRHILPLWWRFPPLSASFAILHHFFTIWCISRFCKNARTSQLGLPKFNHRQMGQKVRVSLVRAEMQGVRAPQCFRPSNTIAGLHRRSASDAVCPARRALWLLSRAVWPQPQGKPDLLQVPGVRLQAVDFEEHRARSQERPGGAGVWVGRSPSTPPTLANLTLPLPLIRAMPNRRRHQLI